LEEIRRGTANLNTVGRLFERIQEEFGEFDEKSRKMDKLRRLVQKGHTYDKYVQEFRRLVRESRYKSWAFVEEFKRGLNKVLRRKLGKAEESPEKIEE